MNIRCFIGASSALLLAWLGVTFLHKVPAERYRQQGRSSSPITGKTSHFPGKMVAENTSLENP